MTDQPQSMMIISQDHMGAPTFSLIAVTESCPFVECIYVPESKQLAVITKIQKDTFHFFPKLDDNGDLVPAKKRAIAGKVFKEERKPIKTFYEYYIKEEKEILDFIKKFAMNSESFNIKDYTKNRVRV